MERRILASSAPFYKKDACMPIGRSSPEMLLMNFIISDTCQRCNGDDGMLRYFLTCGLAFTLLDNRQAATDLVLQKTRNILVSGVAPEISFLPTDIIESQNLIVTEISKLNLRPQLLAQAVIDIVLYFGAMQWEVSREAAGRCWSAFKTGLLYNHPTCNDILRKPSNVQIENPLYLVNCNPAAA